MAAPKRPKPRTRPDCSEILADAEQLGAVVLAEFGLVLPGGEERLGDLAEFLDVVAAVDGAGVDGDRELAIEGKGGLHVLLVLFQNVTSSCRLAGGGSLSG